MSQPDAVHVAPSPRQPDYFAAFLSYLVPGLGQLYQGRTGKGILFLVCLLGLFFTGQAMGDWKNVFLPDVVRGPEDIRNNPFRLPKILNPLANLYHRWQFAGQFWIGAAAWPALWQYNKMPLPTAEKSPFWHNFQKAPEENELNNYLRARDKTPDLGWVYTVIAGVLNILVIYDALAGPAFVVAATKPTSAREEMAARTEGAVP